MIDPLAELVEEMNALALAGFAHHGRLRDDVIEIEAHDGVAAFVARVEHQKNIVVQERDTDPVKFSEIVASDEILMNALSVDGT